MKISDGGQIYPVLMRPIVVLAAVPILTAIMSGCSTPAKEGPATSPAATAPAPSSTAPGVLTGFVCGADANGVWRGKATLQNVGTATNTYTVQFSVVRSSDSRVVGQKEVEFTVKPGETLDVAFPNIVSTGATGLECRASVIASPASPSVQATHTGP